MRYFCTLLFLLALFCGAYAEQSVQAISVPSEAVIEFSKPQSVSLDYLTRIISIDKVQGDLVRAYVNQEELNSFVKLQIPYTVIERDRSGITMYEGDRRAYDFESYPTYDDYISMMYAFASDFPELCTVEKLGTSVQGRDVLAVKISDNVDSDEAEAKFFYNSTIHGDETAGYVLMLRMIDSLLNGYETSARIKNIVDNMEIWISPLSNPDGTYKSGNHTVQGAQRYNYRNIDLNRSFPCPSGNQTKTKQVENDNIINFFEKHQITLAADIHGGVELVCYPWGCWSSIHPDQQWFRDVSREYATTAQQNSKAGYMTDENNGIINGYDWYPVYGELMNYTLYNNNCRLLTLEINTTKLLPSSQLDAHWKYNNEALLKYIEETMTGFHGVVTKYPNGDFIETKVEIKSHDKQNSEVYASAVNGGFFRVIDPGTYSVTFSAQGCNDTTISITVSEGSSTYQDVLMVPYGMSIENSVVTNPKSLQITGTTIRAQANRLEIYNLRGKQLFTTNSSSGSIQFDYGNTLSAGSYIVKTIDKNNIRTEKLFVQ